MQAWERRLNDLWLLLERCHATYMEPELFRLNTNQFLQTSRTVTFIVQKNRDSIPDFDAWYQPIVAAWASDAVMNWAKDSRNKIEKEGDLELHSKLELTLLFTYLVEQDVRLSTGRSELLNAGTKRLLRFAIKHLPSNVIDSAAIKVERKWVANTLSTWELLHAFSYIYTTLYRMCQELAVRLGTRIDGAIPDPTDLYPARQRACQVKYLKLSNLKVHTQHAYRIDADPNYTPPAKMAAANMREKFAKSDSVEAMFETLTEMAELLFENDGYHIPMTYLYDEKMKVVDYIPAYFTDQVEKYIFWRDVADRVTATKAKAVASIGEAWIKDMKHYYTQRLTDLPIIGERLFVSVLDSTGWFRSASWEIVRADKDAKPTLKRMPDDDEFKEKTPFYFAPVLRAFGVPYPAHFDDEPKRRPYEEKRLMQPSPASPPAEEATDAGGGALERDQL